LEKEQRDIADAVFAEMQVDLDSLVQSAVNHMSSWISAEVAFARQGLEKDVEAAVTRADMQQQAQFQELRARQDAEVKNSQTHFASKLELLQSELQSDVRELALAMAGKLHESARHSSSFNDNEAQVKLAALEQAMDAQSKIIETLSQHSAHVDILLGASRKDNDRHASELLRLTERTGDARADIQTCEARAELVAWELRRTHTLLSDEIGKRASCAEVNEIGKTLREWVEDARKMHQASIDDLAKIVEQCRASGLAQSVVLNRHEEWMKELSRLL
jgi:hypothetical protein